jgi:hypothetical protein
MDNLKETGIISLANATVYYEIPLVAIQTQQVTLLKVVTAILAVLCCISLVCTSISGSNTTNKGKVSCLPIKL